MLWCASVWLWGVEMFARQFWNLHWTCQTSESLHDTLDSKAGLFSASITHQSKWTKLVQKGCLFDSREGSNVTDNVAAFY